MTLRIIQPNDPVLEYPAFFNAYPIPNEVHGRSAKRVEPAFEATGIYYVEDYYGRIYDSYLLESQVVFGLSEKMDYYLNFSGLEIANDLRVPFRNIPIYDVSSLTQIKHCIAAISEANSDHTVLIRGQNKIHLIPRSDEEAIKLYGKHVKEPSFLPSHLRSDFDETFLTSLWHSLTAILLNDFSVDAQKGNYEDLESKLFDAVKMRRIPYFNALSLGLAQHYGLPSVGLDLTDDPMVAAWFAHHQISISDEGLATYSVAEGDVEPTVFVFRCPSDAVYDYNLVRPKILPDSRPDYQKAWFGHVGWGFSKNELASYLVCGFRLSPSIIAEIPNDFPRKLFPPMETDAVLQYFMKMKRRGCYEGEASRALNQLYFFA